MSEAVRICAVIPTYDNPRTVRGVVEQVRAQGLPVVVVDDGSGDDGREACAALAAEGLATVERLPDNRGKGAAVKRGLTVARELGFTHAFQIDADGQHDLERIPAFLTAARAHPTSLILGYPEYDTSAPRGRLVARGITSFWVALEVGSKTAIRDAMIGFRVYPITATLDARCRTERMGFDIEILVSMVRAGVPTENLPVPVRYLDAVEGGISHFRPFRDNFAFSLMHSRLCCAGCVGWLWRKIGGPR